MLRRRTNLIRTDARHPPTALRGFTVVEVLVSITIMAILAAILVPAITGIDRRKARLDADRIEDLLTMYAYRDSTTTQQIRIARDGETGGIGLWVKETDPYRPNEPPEWLPDRFSQPVFLEAIEIVDVRIDGYRVSADEWSITRVPTQPRPVIEIDVSGPEIEATLVLDSQGVTPRRLEAGKPNLGTRSVIDLDRLGMSRDEW
ncbi:MAG: type II secretion system protein [Phycisphaerales bacterium]|jgi:prepilin-type N-terminal cleavage/methylation domain-containing protein